MLDIALHLLNNWGHKSIESCKVILVLLVTCFNDIIKKSKVCKLLYFLSAHQSAVAYWSTPNGSTDSDFFPAGFRAACVTD